MILDRKIYILFCDSLFFVDSQQKILKQAGAELGQGQPN